MVEIDDGILRKIDKELQELRDRIGVDRKTLNEVFDKPTLLAFGKLISNRIIEYVDFPISTGKEANIFRAVTPQNKFVVVKVYRIATSNFNKMIYYIQGDPRFAAVARSKREIVYQWVKKELKNLERLQEIGVPAPKPIRAWKNLLVMEYIGDDIAPAPLLKNVKLNRARETYDTIIESIRRMYQDGEMVHSDLSEYNILYHNDIPYIIDLAQGVVIDHPMAMEFLRRDIRNIVTYFRRYGIKEDDEKIFNEIVKGN